MRSILPRPNADRRRQLAEVRVQAALGKKPFPVGNGFLLFVLSDSVR